jgi:hypothetical protein
MPGDAAGLDDRRVGQQGRRTHRNDCAGLPVRSSAGRRAEGARGGKGPVCEDGGFWPPGQ